MQSDTYERPATAEDVARLARAGHLGAAGLERAYALVGHTPDRGTWARFINRGLLALGVLLALAGVIFFIAYNWAELPRLAKLGLVQALLLALVALAAWRGLATLVGRAALLGAATMVGTLFAVFGQVYQTGADSFQLFLSWALLIAPWVFISRWPPMWLLLLLLLNLSLGFFWQQRLTYDGVALAIALGLLNATWLCVWEYAAEREVGWMAVRWLPQVAAIAVFGLLLIPTVAVIIDWYGIDRRIALLGAALYAGFCLLAFAYYRHRHDLFVLSAGALSLVVVATVAGAKLLENWQGSGRWLLLSLFVVATTSAAVALLRQTARSWERSAP